MTKRENEKRKFKLKDPLADIPEKCQKRFHFPKMNIKNTNCENIWCNYIRI